ncbi:hypothetical protein HHK36_028462 [Tetracentron sinense]|uniref:E3 ubiquitin-protein ligase n=1 Tax=Tetracentron sinense TaxID=13715 RepID=A0A834YHA5_TETSI|nr:hypothetical protein HHK36_028462 [Tetracentron sinense]
MDMPFDLGHYIASIHSLLVAGAFSVDGAEEAKDDTLFNTDKEYLDDSDCLRHTKVGRLSQESSVCSTMGRSSTPDFVSKADDIYFDTCGRISIPFSVILLTFECLRVIEHWVPLTRSGLTTSSRLHGRNISSPVNSGFHMSIDLENGQGIVQDNNSMVTGEMGHEHASTSVGFDDSIVEADCATELKALRVLGLSDWPDIVYDVLKGCHPYGFSAFVMEHPLRIRVFCAQVYAGMWRKNGDAAILNCEWYRLVSWSEQSLELDLFLLQCCAALAPPDLYVKRILERFGSSNYLSLNIKQSKLLTYRFFGLSTTDSLRRELVYKLAIGDATHSQLVKSLPHDLSLNDQLQKILDTIAEYSNPSGMKQHCMHLLSLALDIYFLQKQSGDQTCMSTSCYNEDPLHWLAFAGEEIDVGATDKSDAWEGQSMLSLLVSLMRTHKKDLSNFIEAGNCNMASLIEDLLKKFVDLNAGCMTKMQGLAPEVVCHLPQSVPNSYINILGSAFDAEDRKAKARERQTTILVRCSTLFSHCIFLYNSYIELSLFAEVCIIMENSELFHISSIPRYANNDMLYGTGTSGLTVELKEVEELENMFKIPPLDVVLKDEVMRALVIKWTSPHYGCCVVDYALPAGRLAAVKYATLTWLLQLLFKGKRMPDSCDGLRCWYWIIFVDQENHNPTAKSCASGTLAFSLIGCLW